jgi:AcrR family transcriptional regulator
VVSTRTRLSPEERRTQLLDLGVRMLSETGLEDLSIDVVAEHAAISRGLLYHYFSNKRDFHLAVLHRMAQQVIDVTAPRGEGTPVEELLGSLQAYVDFVAGNRDAYLSFVRAAAGGDAAYHEIYEQSRQVLTERIFDPAYAEARASFGLADDARSRLVARGWSALVEQMVLSWLDRPETMERSELLALLTDALPALARAGR